MNDRQAALWSKKREQGKIKYVLINGVLTWSLLLTVLFTLLELVSQGLVNWGWVYVRLVVFGFIGFFISNIKWMTAERDLNERERRLQK